VLRPAVDASTSTSLMSSIVTSASSFTVVSSNSLGIEED
jgi:hypothetical protein